jgi:putative membrane protein
MLFFYAVGRICQTYSDRLPTLLIVALHVIPPALFALVHGAALYRVKGIAVFSFFCVGTGALAETVALRTGFPFGHYYFTDVMGPKIFQLPVLLALAYLGIGYAAWTLALLILGCAGQPLRGMRVIGLPLLASLIMLAWDFSMEPVWATLDRAWIWKDGGAYFGAPLSNFFGWFLTAFLYYQAFALYCRKAASEAARPLLPRFWYPTILLYAVCALGNVLILKQPSLPPVAVDATGRLWSTAMILLNCVLISLAVMLPFALTAWLKAKGKFGAAIFSGLRARRFSRLA